MYDIEDAEDVQRRTDILLVPKASNTPPPQSFLDARQDYGQLSCSRTSGFHQVLQGSQEIAWVHRCFQSRHSGTRLDDARDHVLQYPIPRRFWHQAWITTSGITDMIHLKNLFERLNPESSHLKSSKGVDCELLPDALVLTQVLPEVRYCIIIRYTCRLVSPNFSLSHGFRSSNATPAKHHVNNN